MATSAQSHSRAASGPSSRPTYRISIPGITTKQREKVATMLSSAAGGNGVYCWKDPEEYAIKCNETSRLGEPSVTALNASKRTADRSPIPGRVLHWTRAQPSLSDDKLTRDLVPKGRNTTVLRSDTVSVLEQALSKKPDTNCIKLVDAGGSTELYKVSSVERHVAGPWTFRLFDIKGITSAKGQLTTLKDSAGSEADADTTDSKGIWLPRAPLQILSEVSDSASDDDTSKPAGRRRTYVAGSDEED